MIKKNTISNLLKLSLCLFTVNIEAAASSELKAVQEKLTSYITIDVQDEDGDTPVIIAAQNQNIELIIKLLEIGADLTLRNNENKIFLDFLSEQVQKDCMLAYCNTDNIELIKHVFAKNEQGLGDLQNKYLKLLMKFMLENKNLDTKEIELKRFINLLDGPIYEMCKNIYSNYISLRLYNAVIENDIKTFYTLLNNNKEYINYVYPPPHNITLLMLACIYDKPIIVQILLNLGADLNIKYVNGETALDFAKQKNFNDIVEMLEQKSKKILGKRKNQDLDEEVKSENEQSTSEIKVEKPKKKYEKKVKKPIRKYTRCECGVVLRTNHFSAHQSVHKFNEKKKFVCFGPGGCKKKSYFLSINGLNGHTTKYHEKAKQIPEEEIQPPPMKRVLSQCECGLKVSNMLKHKKVHEIKATEFICFGVDRCKIPSYFKTVNGLNRHITCSHSSSKKASKSAGANELAEFKQEEETYIEQVTGISQEMHIPQPQPLEIPQITEIPQEIFIPQTTHFFQEGYVPQEMNIPQSLEIPQITEIQQEDVIPQMTDVSQEAYIPQEMYIPQPLEIPQLTGVPQVPDTYDFEKETLLLNQLIEQTQSEFSLPVAPTSTDIDLFQEDTFRLGLFDDLIMPEEGCVSSS